MTDKRTQAHADEGNMRKNPDNPGHRRRTDDRRPASPTSRHWPRRPTRKTSQGLAHQGRGLERRSYELQAQTGRGKA